MRLWMGRWREDSTLSGEAVELDIQFLGIVGISFAHDEQHRDFKNLDAPLDVEIGDGFGFFARNLK
jgi:hypothetical protein